MLYAAVYSGVIVKYGKPYLLYRSDGYVARYLLRCQSFSCLMDVSEWLNLCFAEPSSRIHL
jgi:hypothetical protein